MRWSSLLFVFFAASAFAEESTATAYKPFRYEEDYSSLRDPAHRTSPFDALKYIQLRANDPDSYLTLGGELRERLEIFSQPDFGFSGSSEGYLLQRLSLNADLHLGPHVRIFVQGVSGLVWGEERKQPPTQDNPADLQFAFVDITPWISGAERFTMRFGRFGLNLGSGRLVAMRASPNILYKFDGAQLLWNRKDWQATAFLTRPSEERTSGFDLQDDDRTFWGAYLTRFFDSTRHNGLDLYYLGLERENSVFASGQGTQRRHSIGSRLFGERHGWDWNAEGVVQFGKFEDDDILAWTGSIDAGYTWRDHPWQPRFGVKFDVVSGDRDPDDGRLETFDPLFFKSPYFNEAGLLRPSNVIDVHPSISVQPTDRLEVTAGVDVFWRYSTRDAIYDPPGNIQVPVTSDRTPYLGTAIDVSASYRLHRHATLSASYVYFFSDRYIASAGGSDTGFFMTSLSLQF